MCSVKLVRVVCRLTSGWGSTLASSHSEKCGAEGAKGDHTHWLGSRGCLLDSFIGNVLGTVVPVCLLRCSMQRMIAIIRIVVMSNPTDAMRSSNIIVCAVYHTFRCARVENVFARCFPTEIRRSSGYGFNTRVSWYAFSVDFPFSGVVRAKPQKVKLWCNVKMSDGMPPRPSQWDFLLEN